MQLMNKTGDYNQSKYSSHCFYVIQAVYCEKGEAQRELGCSPEVHNVVLVDIVQSRFDAIS